MTTTTSHFQVKPDYFPSEKECQEAMRKKIVTNQRYAPAFNQVHFTAGDIDQFETYRDKSNGILCQDIVIPKDNVFADTSFTFWDKYKNLTPESTSNTFSYLFNKFKKGVFIKVKQGKLDVFLPFSNKNFVNEWSQYIRINPKYGNLLGFIKYVQSQTKYKFFPNAVNKNIDTWYSNNCLVRYEFPINEGDTNVSIASDMFNTLCREREIPDMEFFVNRRDFPLLKNNGTEAYSNMFDSNNAKLVSHDYSTYCPILSMVTAENFADIPIPTGDDWARVSRTDNKFFEHTCGRTFDITPIPWKDKKAIAMFRGASTGCGVTIQTNPRLKVAFLSSQKQTDVDGLPFLDAGITEWNVRPRKLKGEKYLVVPEIKSFPFPLVPRLTPQEQIEYKYLINIEGHVSAFRLSLELSSGSCVLLVESRYKIWFRNMIKPWVHYVPVKGDLSDLIEKIKWCKSHDKKCQKISENSMEFADKYLSKKGILDYLQSLLVSLKKANGVYMYNTVKLTDVIRIREEEILSRENDRHLIENMYELPDGCRSYNYLKAIEYLLLRTVVKSENVKEIFNNKNTTVTLKKFLNFSYAQKITKVDITHEIFVGSILNNLLKSIPNFCYTFMSNDVNAIKIPRTLHLTEYIEGQTFSEWIHSPNFSFPQYIFILLQLSLALHVAQKNYAFVHNDATPWNIILKKHILPLKIDYVIDCDTVYTVETDMIPVFIDTGRSHIVYENEHFGVVNVFSSSSIQDIFTILITSLYEISGYSLSNEDSKNVLYLANFITGTEYHRKKFENLGEMRYFLKKNKQLSVSLLTDKLDLKKKTPMDFVKYIIKNCPNGVTESSGSKFCYNVRNSKQIVDYTLAEDNDEKNMSYTETKQKIMSCPIEDVSLLSTYYTAQTLLDNLNNLYPCGNRDNKKKLIQRYTKVISEKEPEPISYDIPDVVDINLDDTTFDIPENVLMLLEKVNKVVIKSDVTSYRGLLDGVLTYDRNIFVLPEELKKYYKNNFSKLFESENMGLKTMMANIVSLRYIAGYIANSNLELLNSLPKKCIFPQVESYINVFSKIRNETNETNETMKDISETSTKKEVKKTTVVRLKRKDGKVVQDCDVYIGRPMYMGGWKLAGSKWANPFKIDEKNGIDRKKVVEMYKEWIVKQPELMSSLDELKGKTLGCWCKPELCHGDVLAELANKKA